MPSKQQLYAQAQPEIYLVTFLAPGSNYCPSKSRRHSDPGSQNKPPSLSRAGICLDFCTHLNSPLGGEVPEVSVKIAIHLLVSILLSPLPYHYRLLRCLGRCCRAQHASRVTADGVGCCCVPLFSPVIVVVIAATTVSIPPVVLEALSVQKACVGERRYLRKNKTKEKASVASLKCFRPRMSIVLVAVKTTGTDDCTSRWENNVPLRSHSMPGILCCTISRLQKETMTAPPPTPN